MDIGAGVAHAGTVAAAEDLLDAAAVDDDVVVDGGCRVTAAVDALDGVLVAVVDVDEGGAVGVVGGVVGRVVAAAVDGLQGEVGGGGVECQHVVACELAVVAVEAGPVAVGGAGVGHGVRGLIDMYVGVAVGGTLEVVGAEDFALDGGGACGLTLVGRVGTRQAYVDEGVALGAALLVAHRGEGAAAVDGAVDGAAEDVDAGVAVGAAGNDYGRGREAKDDVAVVGGVVVLAGAVVGRVVGAVACGVDVAGEGLGQTCAEGAGIAEGAAVDGDTGVADDGALLGAAVDIALDGGAADGDVSLARAGHGDPVGRRDVDITLAAAEDVAGDGVYEGVLVVVVDGPAAGVAVGVDGVFVVDTYGAAGDGYMRGAGLCHEGMAVGLGPVADACHLAAAEDGAADDGAAADGDRGVGHTAGPDVLVVVDVALAGAHDVADAPVAGQ